MRPVAAVLRGHASGRQTAALHFRIRPQEEQRNTIHPQTPPHTHIGYVVIIGYVAQSLRFGLTGNKEASPGEICLLALLLTSVQGAIVTLQRHERLTEISGEETPPPPAPGK